LQFAARTESDESTAKGSDVLPYCCQGPGDVDAKKSKFHVHNYHSAIQGSWFVDPQGRKVLLRGVNLSGNSKLPAHPCLPSYVHQSIEDDIEVSFVDRPIPLDQCDFHFQQLKNWGFNCFRLCVTWEAVEHFGPGIYDQEYVDFLVKLVRKAQAHGLVCFLDPHQDVWSRACGGSGAPSWTLQLVGLDANQFFKSGAAMTHADWVRHSRRPAESYPKMIWGTNYFKLATATLFTLFFGGDLFAPLFTVPEYIRGDLNLRDPAKGVQHVSVQSFLQFHFIQAMKYITEKMHQAGLDVMPVAPESHQWAPTLLGWDSLNEPSQGWIGVPDLRKHPPWQMLRNGATPTPAQALRAGSGWEQSVDYFCITCFGPMPFGKTKIGCTDKTVWGKRFSSQELHQIGLQRAHKLGRRIDLNITPIHHLFKHVVSQSMREGCIWAAHDVWDTKAVDVPILLPHYFSRHPGLGIELTSHSFMDLFWLPFVGLFSKEIRSVYFPLIIFLDPPVNELPPNLSESRLNTTEVFKNVPHEQPIKHTRNSTEVSTLSTGSGAPLLERQLGKRSNSSSPTRPRKDGLVRSSTEHAANDQEMQSFEPTLGSPWERDANNEFAHDLVYAPHWYDGLTLITKHFWMYNVDFLHIQRGIKNYISGFRLGYGQVKEGMKAQLRLIKEEGAVRLGECPVIIGEIGIPFDMDGNSRTLPEEFCSMTAHRAMDSNFCAIESNFLNVTLWNYCPENERTLGDHWNGEDLSMIHCNQIRPARALIRPYTTRIPGLPERFQFDYRNHFMDFSFSQTISACAKCRADHRWGPVVAEVSDFDRIPHHLKVEFYLPTLHFPNSEQIAIAVTSGGCLVDFQKQSLIWCTAHPDALEFNSSGLPSKGACECCLKVPFEGQSTSPWTRQLRIQVQGLLPKDGPTSNAWKLKSTESNWCAWKIHNPPLIRSTTIPSGIKSVLKSITDFFDW
jgi:hypothetical protein